MQSTALLCALFQLPVPESEQQYPAARGDGDVFPVLPGGAVLVRPLPVRPDNPPPGGEGQGIASGRGVVHHQQGFPLRAALGNLEGHHPGGGDFLRRPLGRLRGLVPQPRQGLAQPNQPPVVVGEPPEPPRPVPVQLVDLRRRAIAVAVPQLGAPDPTESSWNKASSWPMPRTSTSFWRITAADASIAPFSCIR